MARSQAAPSSRAEGDGRASSRRGGAGGVGPRHRRLLLQEKLRENPFLTDEELARALSVSVQTIRLDRMALGIPELRQRTREVAQRTLGAVKALSSQEIVGDLVDIELGQSGVSILETGPEMAFCRTGIVRGHFIFAQAESLALALVDAPVALTGLANVKFKRPVGVGEKLLAHAQVLRRKGKSLVVQVVTRSRGEQVFRAKFVVFPLPAEAVGAGDGQATSAAGPEEE